jgi:hypothetical protein
MTTPDHAENTGDNLRHAAEATGQDDLTTRNAPSEESGTAAPPAAEGHS